MTTRFPHVPTGSAGLDYLISGDDPDRCPGFPKGMFTHIIGPSHILATIESAVLNRHPDVAIRPMGSPPDAPRTLQTMLEDLSKGAPLILVRSPTEDKTFWAVALPAFLDQANKAQAAVVFLSDTHDTNGPPLSLKFYTHVKIVIDEARLAHVHKNKVASTQGLKVQLTRAMTLA